VRAVVSSNDTGLELSTQKNNELYHKLINVTFFLAGSNIAVEK
jgi:hypothetical protein